MIFALSGLCLCTELEWREVFRARKTKDDVVSPNQFATLFNSGDGVLLCGGGSDLHQQTVYPTLFRSTDDGETWEQVYKGKATDFSMYAFQKLENGDIVGIIPGKLLRSRDMGKNWVSMALPNTGFSMNHADGVLLVSRNPGQVYRSKDYGNTFERITYSIEAGCDNLRAISYAGDGIFYMGVGQEASLPQTHARVFKTYDYGLTWTKVLDLVNTGAASVIFSVFAFDTKKVLIGSGGISPGFATIMMTSDGGNTWKEILNIKTIDPTITIVRSFFKDKDNNLFACCDCSYSSTSPMSDEPDKNKNSLILISKDAGETWSLFSRTNTKRLYWMSQTKEGNYIVSTGEYGQILKSVNI